MYNLVVSIVLYNSNRLEVEHVLNLIDQSTLTIKVYLIDNSETDNLRDLAKRQNEEYIFSGANLGYGTAHNVAIFAGKDKARYHLVINTDIDFDPVILERAFRLMDANENIGLLSPKVLDTNGDMQYFCRRLPTPFDLIARRFLPGAVKQIFKERLDQYILYGEDYSKPMNIPNLPGCFMFMRTRTLLEVGGFDERFFLYVEDVDLCRRLNEHSVTLYYPDIVIKHNLARGSYKSAKLASYHIASAINYFNKWGWVIDEHRTMVNQELSRSKYQLAMYDENDQKLLGLTPASLLFKSA